MMGERLVEDSAEEEDERPKSHHNMDLDSLYAVSET